MLHFDIEGTTNKTQNYPRFLSTLQPVNLERVLGRILIPQAQNALKCTMSIYMFRPKQNLTERRNVSGLGQNETDRFRDVQNFKIAKDNISNQKAFANRFLQCFKH